MIVSEDDVSTALAYLAEDPHPIALARYDMTLAANHKAELFAELFLQAEGNIRERECHVELDEGYQNVKRAETMALMEVERHKSRINWADKLIDTWRTENANIRAAERVR